VCTIKFSIFEQGNLIQNFLWNPAFVQLIATTTLDILLLENNRSLLGLDHELIRSFHWLGSFAIFLGIFILIIGEKVKLGKVE